jgi:NADH:ubiquinone reductase (non-electrogenic)
MRSAITIMLSTAAAVVGMAVIQFLFAFPCAMAFAPSSMEFKTHETHRSVLLDTRKLLLHATIKDAHEDYHHPHIVILGGGFGGINTALTLAKLPWPSSSGGGSIKPKITLIDKSERFVFLPLLYELCVEDASLDEVAPTFQSLLDGVGNNNEEFTSFLQAQVEGIDVNNQHVIITKPDTSVVETISYDALVVATGAEISLDSIPGASEYALPFYTVEQALELKRRLAQLDNYMSENSDPPANIVVVGGGYSGVELSLNMVDRFRLNANNNVQVTLVHRGKQVLEYATEFNRKTGLERLKLAGVNVMTSKSVVEVLPCEGDSSELSPEQRKHCILQLCETSKDNESGSEIENTLLHTSLLLWTAGATPTSDRNKGIRNSILPRDMMGRILTSSTLNVPEFPNVFAVGDCSRPTKVPYPATAQVAIQQATVAAVNIFTTLVQNRKSRTGDDNESKLLRPFKFLNLGEALTLGSDDASISTLGGNVELSGPTASWLRRWLYAARMPTPKQGLVAAVDGTGRKLARGAVRSTRSKSKPIDWK